MGVHGLSVEALFLSGEDPYLSGEVPVLLVEDPFLLVVPHAAVVLCLWVAVLSLRLILHVS